MVIRVVEFSSRGTKLERFSYKNQHTRRKLLNFENWCSGEMSKIGHQFSYKMILELMLSKMSITKNVLLNWYSSMKKKLRKIWMSLDIEN